MIIFPGYQVSDFSGNSRAQKLNKAQTKRENIMGIQYFNAYQQGVVSSTLYSIIYNLFILFPSYFCAQLPFLPPPPPLTEHDPPPNANKANPEIMIPPAASKLSAQLPRFHRCKRCLQPTTSDKYLVPLRKILTAAGGRLLFCGRSSAVDAD